MDRLTGGGKKGYLPGGSPGFRQAARLVTAVAAVASNRTEIRFDTPDSSIVTPYRVPAAAIVFFE